MSFLITAIQLVVAAGLINVWIFRNSMATNYRGGDAKNLKEEFAEYGLPAWMYYLIGFLKLLSATLLVVSVWLPQLLFYTSVLVFGLMSGAVLMHLKVKDPFKKYLPATLMLLMSGFLLLASLPEYLSKFLF